MMSKNPDSQPILISACLLGEPCRFDGLSSGSSALQTRLEGKRLIPFCPEVEGGLPIPRPPAEILDHRVLRADGTDVTREFHKGALLGTQLALKEGVTVALLKSRSPACGCGQVYDGSFSKTLRRGDGVFTETLKTAGIDCISDEDLLNNKHSL